MQTLSIQYSDDLLISTGKSKKALEQEMQFLLAVKLFELGRLSVGKAAELCNTNKIKFMDELGRMEIPVINLDDDLDSCKFSSKRRLLKSNKMGRERQKVV